MQGSQQERENVMSHKIERDSSFQFACAVRKVTSVISTFDLNKSSLNARVS